MKQQIELSDGTKITLPESDTKLEKMTRVRKTKWLHSFSRTDDLDCFRLASVLLSCYRCCMHDQKWQLQEHSHISFTQMKTNETDRERGSG